MNQHILRPKPPFFAWKEIAKHWKIMAKISRKNHKTGFLTSILKRIFFFKKQSNKKKTEKISLVD